MLLIFSIREHLIGGGVKECLWKIASKPQKYKQPWQSEH